MLEKTQHLNNAVYRGADYFGTSILSRTSQNLPSSVVLTEIRLLRLLNQQLPNTSGMSRH
ncbi:hypothetical protein HKBW3S43_00210 [Candidatus Hakubella thermalkaliphila]|uniref:Uncharacterized protein n=1 Tax=Candidatus Hakubella thermalkaliphila TaxID=2754717 RepID=A0A6V8NQC9_9ACTN|nr:hypothetical protein HKBW3S06_00708 [Candidatus Hakubella thermalkaliphila]GFP26757.1 hypothetical protein HKBW3S33_00172 [Candidatus Hakubella thermalkaliphila]GFP34417.1 hypothetical protein HKBW3S43_00210 [Candidatus Hakubella thermalkaliphila]